MRKVHKYSSITYYDIIEGTKEHAENMQVLKAIAKNKPSTGRMYYHILKKKIEISAIARCLNNLKRLKLIYVIPGDHRCERSGRLAQHYQLKLKKS